MAEGDREEYGGCPLRIPVQSVTKRSISPYEMVRGMATIIQFR